MAEASPAMEQYFTDIETKTNACYLIANEARKQGFDPEETVDIPLAKNMAERVRGLISTVAPQLLKSSMTERIQELEKEFGALAWEVAFIIAEEVAKEKFCTFKNKLEAMEVGIRTGMAYSTAGIVAAPLEGFVELKIKQRRDGKEYLAMCYSGPIRGAGGTAAALSVVIADHVRTKMGYSKYDPDEKECKRFVAELTDYNERVSNLQYMPPNEEIEFLLNHLPIEIDGDPSEKLEVSNYKDLPRIATNRIRGGVCLVLGEGVAQKAPKLWKRLQYIQKFDWCNLDWTFLNAFLDLQKQLKAKSSSSQKTGKSETKPKLTPNYRFITDLVAGRPVLTHPLAHGGFRLRYGRNRTSGFSAASIHPATQFVLNNYIAIGTQLKVERPGKAAAITVCDSIEGPIVRLKDGSVIQLNTSSEAKEIVDEIESILFLGDLMFNYGDFSENGHMLVPAGYCEEWYIKELEKATVNLFGNLDLEKLSDLLGISSENLTLFFKDPVTNRLAGDVAVSVSKKMNVPLHPAYTYHWKGISRDQFSAFLSWITKAKIEKTEQGGIKKLIIPLTPEGKIVLEHIGIPHTVATNEFIIIESNYAETLLATLNVRSNLDISAIKLALEQHLDKSVLEIINLISEITIRDKGGTFIGARMGRPEKSKMRKLIGSPQALFPVGEEGGRFRCFQSALELGKVTSNFPKYLCECGNETIYPFCENCNKKTIAQEIINDRGEKATFSRREINITHYFNKALESLKVRDYPDLIKGVKGTANKDHLPERIEKGILRAKHGIYVNKDGTTRYDMSELPLTHFKPVEIRTSVAKLRELGYTVDMHGKPLTDKNQVLEIKPQDVILPSSPDTLDETADDVIIRIGNFIDDLLVKFYNLKPYYNFTKKEEIAGHLIIGLAPHISAGIIGRIIGFTDTQGCYAHPLFHAAMRRDCDGDEACFILLMDALLNFSRQFLPDRRGSRTMDSPLVLSSRLIPAEVDDMAHGLDVVSTYPLEFYEACLQFKNPWEVDIEQLKKRLGTEGQYEGIGYTHEITNINEGVTCSAYKILPSMEEKLRGQMELAERIRAVNTSDVAKLVIEKHFIKDIKGNLRKFSMQQFRCVKCNGKFRRPPLIGKCSKCGGKLIFTIAEGSVVKYLQPSISLAAKYNLPPYLKQTLELTKKRIEEVFGKEKEVQAGLGAWFG